jgi:outer membrane murein-binding lipoprotein Lpp
MKRIVIFAVFICELANAQTNFFPLLCCSNRTYTNATIISLTPATALIDFDSGGERISITNLPSELQIRYHYDSVKAKKYLEAQEAKKAAQQERANQEVAAFAAAQNTLSPAQKICVTKIIDMFFNVEIVEANGQSSEAYIPKLPSEVITFIGDFNQAQADAASLEQQVRQARYNANRAEQLYDATSFDDPGIDARRVQAHAARDKADELERDSAAAKVRLSFLQSEAKVRTTIIACPRSLSDFDVSR